MYCRHMTWHRKQKFCDVTCWSEFVFPVWKFKLNLSSLKVRRYSETFYGGSRPGSLSWIVSNELTNEGAEFTGFSKKSSTLSLLCTSNVYNHFTKQGSFSKRWGTWTSLTCTQGCGEKKSQAVSSDLLLPTRWIVNTLLTACYMPFIWFDQDGYLPPPLAHFTYKHTTTRARKQKGLHLHKITNWPLLYIGVEIIILLRD